MSQAVDYFDRWAIAIARRDGVSISAAWRQIEAAMADTRRQATSPPATAATTRRATWGREVASHVA